MVNYSLDATATAIAAPARRALIDRLAAGPASMSELARVADLSLPAVDKHVRLLTAAALVEKSKTGRITELRLQPRGLRPLTDWTTRTALLWESALDRLDALLADPRSGR